MLGLPCAGSGLGKGSILSEKGKGSIPSEKKSMPLPKNSVPQVTPAPQVQQIPTPTVTPAPQVQQIPTPTATPAPQVQQSPVPTVTPAPQVQQSPAPTAKPVIVAPKPKPAPPKKTKGSLNKGHCSQRLTTVRPNWSACALLSHQRCSDCSCKLCFATAGSLKPPKNKPAPPKPKGQPTNWFGNFWG